MSDTGSDPITVVLLGVMFVALLVMLIKAWRR